MPSDVVLVAAVAKNGVIGDGGELPWHHPADMGHFRRTTMDTPVIVGRSTFENIVDRLGEPLDGRTSVVLSRSEPELPDGVVLAGSVGEALDAAESAAADVHDTDTVHVIGGAEVYDAFLDHADRLVLTELDASYDGDVEFPSWPLVAEWVERERVRRDEFAFVTYDRAPGPVEQLNRDVDDLKATVLDELRRAAERVGWRNVERATMFLFGVLVALMLP